MVFRTFTLEGGDEESFLAVDGCREQVTLNLLVLLERTLDLGPCHELVDLSGDLPKFLEVNVPIGQVIVVDFVQKVDVFDKKVEHRDDNLLTAAIGHLRSLCGPLQGCAVVTEVAGWVHVMLWASEREVLSAPSAPMPFYSLHRMSVSWWQSPSPHRMVTRAQSPSQVSAGG